MVGGEVEGFGFFGGDDAGVVAGGEGCVFGYKGLVGLLRGVGCHGWIGGSVERDV